MCAVDTCITCACNRVRSQAVLMTLAGIAVPQYEPLPSFLPTVSMLLANRADIVTSAICLSDKQAMRIIR